MTGKSAGRRTRRPTVTEQIAHTELCIRANARDAAEAEASRKPDPPEGYRKCYDGWWPEAWFAQVGFCPGHSDPPAQVVAAAQLIKLAFTHPTFTDAQRQYYRDAAGAALREHLHMSQQCAEWLRFCNAEYARDPAAWRAHKTEVLSRGARR